MKLRNELTGATLELPPPDELGHSSVIFNGKVVAQVLYSDDSDTVTLGDGRTFTTKEWPNFIISQLKTGWVRDETI